MTGVRQEGPGRLNSSPPIGNARSGTPKPQDLGGFGLDSLVSRDEHHLRNHLQAQGDNGLKTMN